MKINKLLLSSVAAATLITSASASFDLEAVFEKDCQGCHGPAHQGGVGSDLRPNVLKEKNAYKLAETLMNGRPGTAMLAFKKGESIGHEFSKNDADDMIYYLQNFKGMKTMVLTLDNVKSKWRPLNDRMKLMKKYPTAVV
jgi:nitrite reductase (NO-forming)/hydroxylamine reductase